MKYLTTKKFINPPNLPFLFFLLIVITIAILETLLIHKDKNVASSLPFVNFHNEKHKLNETVNMYVS